MFSFIVGTHAYLTESSRTSSIIKVETVNDDTRATAATRRDSKSKHCNDLIRESGEADTNQINKSTIFEDFEDCDLEEEVDGRPDEFDERLHDEGSTPASQWLFTPPPVLNKWRNADIVKE